MHRVLDNLFSIFVFSDIININKSERFQMKNFFLAKGLLLISICLLSCSSDRNKLTLVVGAYTNEVNKDGIYTYEFDQETGSFSALSTIETANASFLAIRCKNIYAVNENDSASAGVTSFAFDPKSGEINQIVQQNNNSSYPCHIVEGDGFVATANYGGGEISIFQASKQGELSSLSEQISFDSAEELRHSHIHCLIFSPDRDFLFATDLGKDSIYRFEVASRKDIKAGKPALNRLYPAISLPKGSGPRHLVFDEEGRYSYLINELSGMVNVYYYNDGHLNEIQSILSDIHGGKGGADIHISHDGKHLYASNRLKEDGIAIFDISPDTGLLTYKDYVRTGIHPRNFCISPNDKYVLVACRDRGAVEIYERNKNTGALVLYGNKIEMNAPVFVQLVDRNQCCLRM